jgi:hypothetical protein
MLVTGWDYPALMATPEHLIEEKMLIENTKGKYYAELKKQQEQE